jgi:protein-L-isoaspartate(D-aspartate) O-methyltransferase
MSETGRISPRVREQLIQQLRDQGIRNLAVLEAIRNTPRHTFVEPALQHRAYENISLPIGNRQTISQPYIVARMTEMLLEGIPKKNVLEVGTGSGYQTAVLARLIPHVYSIERISVMLPVVRARLKHIKVTNVTVCHGDGNKGWAEHAPFDGILVTAAAVGVPTRLYEQLSVGGKIVIPIGGENEQQNLLEVIKTEDGPEYNAHEPVRFVPMRSGEI